MNDGNQAREWDEAARHLVRAHGAGPDRLLSLGLPLNKLKWVHFDTHAALEIAGLQSPVGHVHRELPDPDRDARSDEGESFSPLRPAPSAPTPAGTFWAQFYADYRYTGLPQTGMVPHPDTKDVTGRWASMAVQALSEHFAAGCPKPSHAAAVAFRFQVKASFPAVPGRPDLQRRSSARAGQQQRSQRQCRGQ